MSRQMNKAYLRQMENKKFFRGSGSGGGGGSAVPEDQIKSKY